MTYWLQVSCSTSWAKEAFFNTLKNFFILSPQTFAWGNAKVQKLIIEQNFFQKKIARSGFAYSRKASFLTIKKMYVHIIFTGNMFVIIYKLDIIHCSKKSSSFDASKFQRCLGNVFSHFIFIINKVSKFLIFWVLFWLILWIVKIRFRKLLELILEQCKFLPTAYKSSYTKMIFFVPKKGMERVIF